jgi:hypothetical protein
MSATREELLHELDLLCEYTEHDDSDSVFIESWIAPREMVRIAGILTDLALLSFRAPDKPDEAESPTMNATPSRLSLTHTGRDPMTDPARTFPPGSDDAIEKGCTCPVLDNGRGRVGPPYWVRDDCPLHGGGRRPSPSRGQEP